MDPLRNWREWLGRWMSGPPATLDIADTLQPVVVVDDVSSLSVPPLVPMWAFYGSPGAVAGQFPTVIIQPQARAIIISRCKFNIGQQYGVNDGIGTGLAAAVVPYKVQGPLAAVPDALSFVGTTATDLAVGTLSGVLAANVTHDLGLLVVPGQFFWLQFTTALTAVEYERTEWVEIPADVDQVQTSMPRV